MKLTAKQEKFAQLAASGSTQSDAYRQAYDASKMRESTIWRKATELYQNGKVTARIDSLKAEIAAKELWTREQSVNALKRIADDKEARPNDIIQAVKELNNMHGFNAPKKHEISNPDGSMKPEPTADLSKLDLDTLLKIRETIQPADTAD